MARAEQEKLDAEALLMKNPEETSFIHHIASMAVAQQKQKEEESKSIIHQIANMAIAET